MLSFETSNEPEVSRASSLTHYPNLATETLPYIQINIFNLF